MEWVQFIAGIGVGTLGAKLLDILLLQRRVEEAEHRAWLRDKRFEAFADVTKEFLSLGYHEGTLKSGFQSYGTVSKSLLLVDDESLVERIDQFVVSLDLMNRLTDSTIAEDKIEAEQVYLSLVDESRAISKQLRSIILQSRI